MKNPYKKRQETITEAANQINENLVLIGQGNKDFSLIDELFRTFSDNSYTWELFALNKKYKYTYIQLLAHKLFEMNIKDYGSYLAITAELLKIFNDELSEKDLEDIYNKLNDTEMDDIKCIQSLAQLYKYHQEELKK